MTWADFKWSELNTVLTVMGLAFGWFLAQVRSAMRGSFVSQSDFDDFKKTMGDRMEHIDDKIGDLIERRLAAIEMTIAGQPSRQDMQGIYDRLRHVETTTGAIKAGVDGMERVFGRLANQVDLLVENELGDRRRGAD